MPELKVKVIEDGITWGDLELFAAWQEAGSSGDGVPADLLREIVAFFDRTIEGGARAVPLKYTAEVFAAIMDAVNMGAESPNGKN